MVSLGVEDGSAFSRHQGTATVAVLALGNTRQETSNVLLDAIYMIGHEVVKLFLKATPDDFPSADDR